MTTVDAKVYVTYKLYFDWNFKPKDVQHYCAWWKFLGVMERSNRDSVISITQRALYEYYMKTPLALQNLDGIDIVKFILRHQFDTTWDRIKNIFWGVGAIVLKTIFGV